ncbi:MAG: ABC transporter permease [Betaproteobacteria bacterium]|nr:ABC transporter permease [Betaproteobacteria bacterium]MCL2886050.1 ABC transporter permease [Betaproteobacteria bacterium]
MIALAWRLLGRELRSGELRLLFAALALAVAAVTAVGFFADRVHGALERGARQLLGGDLALSAEHPLPDAYREEAARRRVEVAETLSFPSMVGFAGAVQLADIKAVSAAYPLRGSLSAASRLGEAGAPVDGGPRAGTVWLDERLATALRATPGDVVMVGRASLRVAAILTLEPDRGIGFFNLGPRLLLHLDDIPASGLVQFGSRLRYRLLLAGEDSAIDGLRGWLQTRLTPGERLEDMSNARPEIRNALERAERFLGLATLLTVILAAVAVALAARRYLQRHLDACAVMRCLGMTQKRLLGLHALLFFWLALVAAVAGSLLGLAAHFLLVEGLRGLLTVPLPPPGWRPLGHGAAVAAVLLFGFALPPLLQLAKVPTLRVLRRELGPPRLSRLGGYLLGCLLLGGLIVAVAGNVRLGMLALAGFAGALALFWLLARLLLAGVSRLRGIGGPGWRQGLASLARQAPAASLQIVALAVGIMALLLLTVTRGELLAAWTRSLPADAPNRFVINIQPEQRAEVAQVLTAAGVEAELAPMVRARLLRIAGRSVAAASYPDDERAQRLIEREFNLSWRAALPPANRITAGRWFAPQENGQALASVEEGLARTLGIALGDELVFSVAGNERTVRVSSLRKLDWDSMRVNFFVLTPPGVIDDLPASYITSFHLPPSETRLGVELVGRFPNLTVIDITAVIAQLNAVMEQVAGAVRFVFLFTLLAGGIVLYAALLTLLDERRHALAVMRALGARRRQLAAALLAELAIIGGSAGLLAAGGALLVGQIIAWQIFQLELAPALWLPPLAALGGALAAIAAGWWAVRRLLAIPPLAVLRSGE